jgi:Carboxypeptidase regulatory-like domain/TonB dependent receptor-like, beta-barrel
MNALLGRTGVRVLMGLLFSVLTCTALSAQSTAQISGVVRDQSGAVLPGVEVTATQTDTGLVRNVVTNETGAYTMPNLPVGPYRLEAMLPGFTTFAQTGIVLAVGANPVINISLTVGQVSETIEVQANAALVETRSTGVGQVIDNTRVLELPLNGRNVTELIVLSGAAVNVGNVGTQRNYPTPGIVIAGGSPMGVTYLLDGGTHNDPYNNLSLPMPFPDALQEFKVDTSALTAQYGQHAAGAVNAVTKSGTNEFHGDVFEFLRNGSLNARNAWATSRDSLKRNQFGGVLGGPIVRNKLFFFVGEQTTLQRSAPTTSEAFVPTPAMLAGDWTTITSPACNTGRQITLRAPFVNNRIDPSLFSLQALNLLKQKGFPNTSDACGRVSFGQRSVSNEHTIVSKVDFTKTQKHTLFGRWTYARLDTPTNFDGVNLLSATTADYKQRAQSFVLGDTYLIGATTVSSFRATFLRTVNDKRSQDYFSLADIGVKGVYIPSGEAKFSLISVAGGFNIYGGPGAPGYNNAIATQFAEDVSTVRGSHQIGFGANFIHTNMNFEYTTQARGEFQFTATNTGMGLGDFMTGKANQFRQQGVTTYYFRQHYLGLYLQDTWKANSRLTVNAGLRWEPHWLPWEKQGRVLSFDKARFDQGIRSKVFNNAPAGLLFPGDAGGPTKSFSGDTWLLFSPRLGLAWDPAGDGRMTIRAAYGIFPDYPHLFHYDHIKASPPWGADIFIAIPPGGFEEPWRDILGGNPFPIVVDANVRFSDALSVVSIPKKIKPPYINQWNLSIQRQVGRDWLVAANYLGNSMVHVMSSAEINPAVFLPGASCVINGRSYSPCSSTANTAQRRLFTLQNPVEGPKYSNTVLFDDGGTTHFGGLMLSVQKRRSSGVTIQGNYTWSHCIDEGPTFDINGPGRTSLERRGFDYGNCDSDRRHNFNMSTVYEIPQFSSRTLRTLATGWSVSGIVRVLSGSYLSVQSGVDGALTGFSNQRANEVLQNPYAPNKNKALWLNPAAFAQPALGTFGNLGRNTVLGPGRIQIDMGLTRSFQIRESQSVEFRAEAFNLPNHMNPGNPILNLSTATFGQIRSALDPRILQFALKYVF